MEREVRCPPRRILTAHHVRGRAPKLVAGLERPPGQDVEETVQAILGRDVRVVDLSEGSLEIKDSLLAGIRGEAHLNNYIGLALSFSFARPDYEARLSSPSSLTQTGDFAMNWIDGDLTWRFFPTRFTPFASAGIGAFNIAQKKITDSQGQAIFIAEQHFEYHGAGGVEWAMGDHLVLKASGRYSRSYICCGNVGKHDLHFMEALFGVAYRSGPPQHHYGPF